MGNLTSIDYGIGKYLVDSDATQLPTILNTRYNLSLLQFRLAANKSYARFNLTDGIVDAFVDESGVDTGSSANETYDAANDLYSPTGGNTNMTLISNSATALAAPAYGRIIIFEEDVDASTINTDIKGYVSRDATNYTEITLVDEGFYDGTKRILAASATLTTTSGVAMRWKITTHNTKNLKIHGVSMLWAT